MISSVYIHIPFCRHKCHFCDFTVFAGQQEQAEAYCQAVCREIQNRLSTAAIAEPLTSVFYGGGTPGMIQPELISLIHETLQRFVSLASGAEITLETTPCDITLNKLEKWMGIGINRLSVGVESFKEEELTAIGRGQGRDDARQGLSLVQQANWRNVNLDLMWGLPSQTLVSWQETLQEALSFGFPHLSAYGLILPEHSLLLKRHPAGPGGYHTEEVQVEMYECLLESCGLAGLKQYEISNFCKDGYESRHNLSCWDNQEYLAFGVGAHRYVNDARSANTRSLTQYLKDSLALESHEVVGGETKIQEAIFLGLRTRQGINLPAFYERYGVDLEKRWDGLLGVLSEGGFLEHQGPRLFLTSKGMLASNLVLAKLC